ncbi:MAG: carbohydrate ABC transporter permease [Actinobacteria bacterium]|nr:carbohydrate ABC transporter permease [Actinomycetota bacterium]
MTTLTTSVQTIRKPVPLAVRSGRVLKTVLTYLALLLGCVIYIFPFFWMVTTSLKTVANIYLDPPQWIPAPAVWANYVEMWKVGKTGNWLINSTVVTGVSVVAITASSTVVAYGFSRFRWPGSRVQFVLLLSTLMLPGHMTIIPKYVMFNQVGWLDTLWPLIVPTLFGAPFFIFLLRQFFQTLPRELDEAARMDGASSFYVLTRVLMPLSIPALSTVAALTFVSSWTDFFEPLVYLGRPESQTWQVGLFWFRTFTTGGSGYSAGGTEASDPSNTMHLLMGASVVSITPMVIAFFLAQKQFIQGVALTGIKG